MNDQPPPGPEKKPRRRNAPRKRAATKRAPRAAKATDATVVPPPDAAGSDGVFDAAVAPASTPATDALVEWRPSPRAAQTSRPSNGGETPNLSEREPGKLVPARESDATSATTGEPADVEARLDPASLAQSGAAGDVSVADAASHRHPSDVAPERHHDAPVARASVEAASAPKTPEAAAEPVKPASMRQASLRPGELIRVPLSVRWRDLDAFNHVNNSKYLSYLEEARLRWMLSVPGMGLDEHVAPVVAASNLNYRRPIGWPGDVVIELFVERIGGSSLTIGHRIVDSKEGDVVYCDGNVVMVWIDRETGRSAPLPEGVRAACR